MHMPAQPIDHPGPLGHQVPRCGQPATALQAPALVAAASAEVIAEPRPTRFHSTNTRCSGALLHSL